MQCTHILEAIHWNWLFAQAAQLPWTQNDSLAASKPKVMRTMTSLHIAPAPAALSPLSRSSLKARRDARLINNPYNYAQLIPFLFKGH